MQEGNYISVIVPVYNAEKYLNKCIQSILRQTYQNFEVILVDDGSKDLSGELCEKWKVRDKRIRVVHKENGGLVSAWCKGLENTLYDWIVFLDSDDWVEPQHLESLVLEQKRTDANIVVTRMKQVNKSSSVYLGFSIETKYYSGKSLTQELYPVMLNAGGFEKRGVPVSRCSKLIKKSLLDNNLIYCSYETTYEEDLNIIFPVLMDADSISLIEGENAAYCYRMLNDSMLHSYDKNMKKSINHVYQAIIQACHDKEKEGFLLQVHAEYLSAMIRCYTNELQNPESFSKAKDNIKKFSEDCLLKRVLKEVNWNHYPLEIKIVIYVLQNFNWFHANITTGLLYIIKKLKSCHFKRRRNEDII